MTSVWAPAPSPLDRTIDLGVIDWDAIIERYEHIIFITTVVTFIIIPSRGIP